MRNEVAGLAHDDGEVVEFLRGAGLPLSADILDDPVWVEWRGGPGGGRAHSHRAGPGPAAIGRWCRKSRRRPGS
ncbi:hypothetical protein [Streptomyces mirabilis]|uniref:hypothetical protein n=1 Tax=Streptomyces mirabilis TaxID=68239 RepID=UPI0036E40A0F